MDGCSVFGPTSVTDEGREFKFIAKVNDNGTWLEIDESKSVKKLAGMGGLVMNYNGNNNIFEFNEVRFAFDQSLLEGIIRDLYSNDEEGIKVML